MILLDCMKNETFEALGGSESFTIVSGISNKIIALSNSLLRIDIFRDTF